MNKHFEIKAKGKPDFTTLYDHLYQVKIAAEKFAYHIGLDVKIAGWGGVLHDIGKVTFISQERLNPTYIHTKNEDPYRHEITSLFFISLFPKEMHPYLIEMIIGHHKSIIMDKRNRGLFDLLYNYGFDKVFELHSKDYDKWMPTAIEILGCFGVPERQIPIEEAKQNFLDVINYCENNLLNVYNYSKWRGVLMGADHFASAMVHKTAELLKPTFKKPNLDYYHNRKHELYPLSNKKSDSQKKHTIVTAGTGAGKTDFVFRRCNGRVFYVLPFTASINAMYCRIKNDIEADNQFLDVRVLHSSSKLQVKSGQRELKLIQSKFGASIKVLTPHQIACIAFGVSGYEATLLDLAGCDVILDEVHTYSDKIQGIVLKMIEMLNAIDCRIHIATATLPTLLYKEILKILGEDNVYQVKLTRKEMRMYDRHKIFKHSSFDETIHKKIRESLKKNEKVLIVRNRVKTAQETYQQLRAKYPNTPILLIHGKYKRGIRNELEVELIGLTPNGESLNEFNTSDKACIVVSTQVVEVSIDISFDFMVTDCAPIDSLIQRFGRINRKRTLDTIGKYKRIYVLAPTDDAKEAKPYSLEILQKTYKALPHRKILREHDVQKLIDSVYDKLNLVSVDAATIYQDGEFNVLRKLENQSKSILFEEFGIMSTNVILEGDVDEYLKGDLEKRNMLEIPVAYHSIANLNLPQLLDTPNKPFIVNNIVYDDNIGLQMELLKDFGYPNTIL